MDLRKLKKLIDLVQESGIAELEVKEGEESVRITRAVGAQQTVFLPQPGMQPMSMSPGMPAAAPALAAPVDTIPPVAAGHVVKSPMVGTFYRSSTPGGKVFVDIGDSIGVGDVLCIIEAMKLMNEIDSEYDGQVVNVYVESGQPVQYGERLFAIRTL